MKAKKNQRHRSEQRAQVSAGRRDMLGITQWRKEHPKATWAESEAAIDEQINQVRAQLIQDVVQMQESENGSQMPEEERPKGVTCGKPLWARGKQPRWIQTNGGEAVKLTRTYGTCPQCEVGFFPLDEELGLVSGGLTPRGEDRRGLERAAEVCVVQDGAGWLQGLVDYHRADAVRILDAGACS